MALDTKNSRKPDPETSCNRTIDPKIINMANDDTNFQLHSPFWHINDVKCNTQ